MIQYKAYSQGLQEKKVSNIPIYPHSRTAFSPLTCKTNAQCFHLELKLITETTCQLFNLIEFNSTLRNRPNLSAKCIVHWFYKSREKMQFLNVDK